MVKITLPQIPTTTLKFLSQQNFPSPRWADIPRFPTGVENMGGLNRYMGGRVNMLLKNICEGVHMLVMLPVTLLAIVMLPANLLELNFFTHIFQGF